MVLVTNFEASRLPIFQAAVHLYNGPKVITISDKAFGAAGKLLPGYYSLLIDTPFGCFGDFWKIFNEVEKSRKNLKPIN